MAQPVMEPPIPPAMDDRRGSSAGRVVRELRLDVPYDQAAYEQEQFATRARTLFYARIGILAIGLAVLAFPGWSETFGVRTLWAFAVYFGMVAYTCMNYLVIDSVRAGRAVTFVTLCLDLLVMVYMIAASGGLSSPLLATQLMFTTLFVILFPKPLAILPPLLTLPIVAKIDQLLHPESSAVLELFVLVWYAAINFIVVYVIVYLNQREQAQHNEVVSLQSAMRELAVVEERNRLAREIHDGLGASLSSLIIQAEFLETLTRDHEDRQLADEILELKGVAEESIDELRRNISMMRDDFELLPALEDYCRTWESRSHLPVKFRHVGRPPELDSEMSLTIFRVLQECLTNATRHAKATRVDVELFWTAPRLRLSVRDDGRGFDATGPLKGHYGLTNMVERARNVNGQVEIESKPGEGTRITLEIEVIGSQLV